MHNPEVGRVDVCGLDVSAKELVVMVRRDGKTEPHRTFAIARLSREAQKIIVRTPDLEKTRQRTEFFRNH